MPSSHPPSLFHPLASPPDSTLTNQCPSSVSIVARTSPSTRAELTIPISTGGTLQCSTFPYHQQHNLPPSHNAQLARLRPPRGAVHTAAIHLPFLHELAFVAADILEVRISQVGVFFCSLACSLPFAVASISVISLSAFTFAHAVRALPTLVPASHLPHPALHCDRSLAKLSVPQKW